MKRSLAVLVLTLTFAGCGFFGGENKEDETVGWSAQRLYSEAKDNLNSGNYETAVRLYEKLESRYPFGRFAQQAQLETAYAHFKAQEPEEAIAACDRFIKLHPNHPNIDYAYYLKGIVSFNEDQGLLAGIADQDPSERDPQAARDSFAAFKELVKRYPDSKYAPDALARMKWLINALASHEVHVARYYIKRGAFLAAANRAQFAVKTYPEAPATEEALFIMALAYDRMEMASLRDDARRVLETNFPASPYLKGDVIKKDPWWKLWGTKG